MTVVCLLLLLIYLILATSHQALRLDDLFQAVY